MASVDELLQELRSLAFDHNLFSSLHSSSAPAADIKHAICHLLERALPPGKRDSLQAFLGFVAEVAGLFAQRRGINLEIFALESEIDFADEKLEEIQANLDLLGSEETEERDSLLKRAAAATRSKSEFKLEKLDLEARRDAVDQRLSPLGRHYRRMRGMPPF